MRLAYSSNAYMRTSIEEAINRIAALGYQGVELMADAPHLWPASTTDEQIGRLRRRLDRLGLVVSNVNAFMMSAVGDFWRPSWIERDANLRRQRVEHTIGAIRMAAKLGARCITTEPGGPLEPGMMREEALDLFVTGLSSALTCAEEENVLLLVEPEPDLLIETPDQFLDLTRRVSSPALGLNFDIGHFFCVGAPLAETVTRLKHLTRHYHLEDIGADRVHHHLIPGDGAIDFPPVLRAIQATGYDGWITVELYPYVDHPDEAGRRAREFLLPILPQ